MTDGAKPELAETPVEIELSLKKNLSKSKRGDYQTQISQGMRAS